MPEESHGFLHFGKQDDKPEPAPTAQPPAEEHHGLLDLFKKEEPPPPPPPPEKPHGLFHFGEQHQEEQRPAAAVATAPKAASEGWAERLFHRTPVTPEPASPQRPQIFRHHSFRSALYIGGSLCLLAGIVPGLLPGGYRFYAWIAAGALLIGGILLTGDWHPLTGMFGLRRAKLPTTTAGVATYLAEREAKDTIEKVTREDEPAQSPARRFSPWRWPWSEQAREAAQEKQAEQAKAFKHVGLAGKVLMGIMAAVMAYGANIIVQQAARPANLNGFESIAHWAIVLLAIGLILFIVATRIRSFRHHWLSPFGMLRRLLIFFVVTAVVALAAGILTKDPLLGQGYGEAIGGLVGLLAVLF